MSSNTENKIRKTLLTPCRHVGLKRKSVGNTPNTSFDLTNSPSPLPHVPNTIVNSSLTDSGTITVTPTRHGIEKSGSRSRPGKKLKVLTHLVNDPQTPSTSETIEEVSKVPDYEEDEGNDTDSQIERIEKRISEKKSEIEKLEMNSKNVKQHNLITLNSLIIKWRRACQTALKDLSHEYQNLDKQLTMSILLKQLGIPYELVRYSETELDFQD
ncbi:uncharacterized protein LOC135831920 [Planococcus citri]|uniref:uncharacterized protein LOC135831920 n=1 Tax=Planococcus citri TaxID=170843 RepID=UPI0031FA4690